jgi:Lrp/AsnC family leucine-responsive transcriptional regulator
MHFHRLIRLNNANRRGLTHKKLMQTEIDNIDLNILRVIQDNVRTSAQEIGETVGLSASAVQRRITSLKDIGVIQKEVAILSAEALGRDLTLVVEVALENDTKEVVNDFIASLICHDEVTQCYYVTGAMDYVLIYQARNMAEYDRFTQRVFFENRYVKTFNTKVVIRPIKVSHKVSF